MPNPRPDPLETTPAVDVLVAGTGPVGLAAALALAGEGLAVALAGPPVTPEGAARDRRTTALFGGSVELIRHLGAWSALEGQAAPLTGLRLVDATGGLLRAPETLFRAEDVGRAAFGWNIENRLLVMALAEIVDRLPRIVVLGRNVTGVAASDTACDVTLDDGAHLAVRLVVGADGRGSITRGAAGIATRTWSYPQSALVAQLGHSRGHDGVSTELHRRAGPLTTVPLPGLRSSLVWVDTPEATARRLALAEAEIAAELEAHLEGLLGTVERVAARAAFPLSGLSAEPIGRARTMLAGEAAHVLPPIGAQGLNLGFRDVAWIAEIAGAAHARGEDIGANPALEAYIAARRTDVATRSLAIDALNRSLILDLLPLDLARGAGLVALAAIPMLRRSVMREGIAPGGAMPRLLRPIGERT